MMIDVMRTTLNIDDDVLAAARGLAGLESKSTGQVLSELARQSLQPKPYRFAKRNGVPQLRRKSCGVPITPELIRRLDEETVP